MTFISRFSKSITSRLTLIAFVFCSATLSGCGGSSGDAVTVATKNPSVDGPIAGSPTLLGTTSFDLASVGYEQNEYFISGEANSYSSSNGTSSDGKWTVSAADAASYKSRILVYRPIDPAAFNGTVIIEWLNVSSGAEASSFWIMAHTELIRKGYAWVGVSAQKAGIEGGGANLAGLALYLKAWNPTRYSSLSHPGDKYSYDIFSQAAKAVLSPSGVDPLGGLKWKHALAAGESQSADYLVTYVNAFARLKNLFGGYLIHSRVHGTAGLTPPELTTAGIDFSQRATVHIRDDLNVPVLMVQTETDLFQLGSYPDLQDDSANFRLWEIAGAAHADLYVAQTGAPDLGTDPNIANVTEVTAPNPIITCGKPVNDGPQHFIINAAVAALDNWVRNGVAPAHADRLEVDAQAQTFVRDSLGNALGGIRTSYVDAPVAVLSGEGQTGNILCSLFGTTQMLSNTQLLSLYPTHATFTSEVNTSLDNAIRQGFLLQTDGDLIKTWAQSANIGAP